MAEELYIEEMHYREAFKDKPIKELEQKIREEESDLKKVEILLKSIQLGIDIDPSEKELKVARLKGTISSAEKRIEVLKELLYEKQQDRD